MPSTLHSEMTTREVAQHFGVETREVVYAARRGKLEGRKLGWQWVFDGSKLPKEWPIKKRGGRA